MLPTLCGACLLQQTTSFSSHIHMKPPSRLCSTIDKGSENTCEVISDISKHFREAGDVFIVFRMKFCSISLLTALHCQISSAEGSPVSVRKGLRPLEAISYITLFISSTLMGNPCLATYLIRSDIITYSSLGMADFFAARFMDGLRSFYGRSSSCVCRA